MTLLISAHFVKAGRVGGAEQMLYNLIHGLVNKRQQIQLICSEQTSLDKEFHLWFNTMGYGKLLISCSAPSRFLTEQLACLDGRMKGNAILFPNYFTPPFVPRRCGRVVTVIHDLQYRHFPEFFLPAKRMWLSHAHRLTLMCADQIVVISDAVRQDIVQFYGEGAADKTTVIHNPISWSRFQCPEVQHPFNGRPYILSIAAHYPQKNLSTLVCAFAQIKERYPDFMLVLVGQLSKALLGHFRPDDVGGVVASQGVFDRVHLTGYVSDTQLGQLYRHATLFAFPSVFEGFGMPPVEAMGLGIPTLTTRCASLPEVTLGEAMYVNDPYDTEEWAMRIKDVLDDSQKHRPGEDTINRLRRRYDPAHIAEQYLTVFADSGRKG